MLTMDVNEFSELIQEDDVVVLDVRTPEEFSEGYIDKALNIDFYRPDFSPAIDSLEKAPTYAVYCRSGKRSTEAIQIMRTLGFNGLFNLDGGIIEWANAGKPVMKNTS